MAAPTSSPYASKDPERHARSLGRIDPGDVHEFYGPFTMVDDLVECVRVISPSYGEMDFLVVLRPRPVTVYASTDLGERYLKERYPGARRFRVGEPDLRIDELDRGRALVIEFHADSGPVRGLSLVVRAKEQAEYRPERYEAQGVWVSSLDCFGIDMRVEARALGVVRRETGNWEAVDRPATLFRGSYGLIRPGGPAKETPTLQRPVAPMR